jgi:hypothetical protein
LNDKIEQKEIQSKEKKIGRSFFLKKRRKIKAAPSLFI